MTRAIVIALSIVTVVLVVLSFTEVPEPNRPLTLGLAAVLGWSTWPLRRGIVPFSTVGRIGLLAGAPVFLLNLLATPAGDALEISQRADYAFRSFALLVIGSFVVFDLTRAALFSLTIGVAASAILAAESGVSEDLLEYALFGLGQIGLLAFFASVRWQLEDDLETQSDRAALAAVDDLTGLVNRRGASEALDVHASAARADAPTSVILFDLDHFKEINDTHGHAAGDAVLRAIPEILAPALRSRDVLARWGGEEFLVILPDTDAAEARTVAERLRALLATSDLPMPVSASFGVRTVFDAAASPDIVLRSVDRAMYRAKDSGRNRVMVAA